MPAAGLMLLRRIFDREHGTLSFVEGIRRYRAAGELLERLLATELGNAQAGEAFIEITVEEMTVAAEEHGVEPRDLQFVLNGLRTQAYCLGARDRGRRYDAADTVRMLRDVARAVAAGTTPPHPDVIPVHRFAVSEFARDDKVVAKQDARAAPGCRPTE